MRMKKRRGKYNLKFRTYHESNCRSRRCTNVPVVVVRVNPITLANVGGNSARLPLRNFRSYT